MTCLIPMVEHMKYAQELLERREELWELREKLRKLEEKLWKLDEESLKQYARYWNSPEEEERLEKEKWDAIGRFLSQKDREIPALRELPAYSRSHVPIHALGNQCQVREVSGILERRTVSAFPDSGSSFNIISKDLVSELGPKINKFGSQLLRLPQGEVRSLGTVSLPFQFKGERTCYSLIFHVMEECVHSCVLGRRFLKDTKTLTKHIAKRVTKRMVDMASLFRVCLLGSSQERLLGSVNGQTVGALADTGAYINVISRSAAEQLGLEIMDGKDHRTELQFMDGSVASTSGMALDVEWRFGAAGESPAHRLNFHVLNDLPCDLILCEDFLFENNVFSAYEDCFYDDVPESNLLLDIAFIGFLAEVSKKPQAPKGQRSATTYQGIHEALQSTGQNVTGQVDELPQVQTQPQAQADESHGEPGISSNANIQGQTPDTNATQHGPRQKLLRVFLLFRGFRRDQCSRNTPFP